MNNAEKFKQIFGIYATELWAMSEEEFIKWINSNFNCDVCVVSNEDTISRQAAIDAVHEEFDGCLVWDESGETTANEIERILEGLPSAQPEDWMEQNKDRILKAGMEGREVEFRIGGRLFAIREKAQ